MFIMYKSLKIDKVFLNANNCIYNQLSSIFITTVYEKYVMHLYVIKTCNLIFTKSYDNQETGVGSKKIFRRLKTIFRIIFTT